MLYGDWHTQYVLLIIDHASWIYRNNLAHVPRLTEHFEVKRILLGIWLIFLDRKRFEALEMLIETNSPFFISRIQVVIIHIFNKMDLSNLHTFKTFISISEKRKKIKVSSNVT